MNKKRLSFFAWVCLVAGVILPISAHAEMKIGYVDSTQIMKYAPQAKKFIEILDKELEPRRNKLLKKQGEIKKLEESLIRDVAIMSDTEKAEAERSMRSMKRDLRRMQEEFSDDVTLKRNEELAKLQKKVVDTIQAFAEENNYDLIINESVVVFASEALDITDKIIKKLGAEQ